jgi:hypothetical protein
MVTLVPEFNAEVMVPTFTAALFPTGVKILGSVPLKLRVRKKNG